MESRPTPIQGDLTSRSLTYLHRQRLFFQITWHSQALGAPVFGWDGRGSGEGWWHSTTGFTVNPDPGNSVPPTSWCLIGAIDGGGQSSRPLIKLQACLHQGATGGAPVGPALHLPESQSHTQRRLFLRFTIRISLFGRRGG